MTSKIRCVREGCTARVQRGFTQTKSPRGQRLIAGKQWRWFCSQRCARLDRAAREAVTVRGDLTDAEIDQRLAAAERWVKARRDRTPDHLLWTYRSNRMLDASVEG